MQCTKITVRFEFCIFLAVLLLFVPVRLLISWLFAAFVHEMFHYTALRVCRVKVFSLAVGLSGAVMETAPMGMKEEIVCALAGPAGGLLLLLVAKQIPYVSLFGAVQSFYNLLPVYPLDGGRVLQCVAHRYFGQRSVQICLAVRWIVNLFAICVLLLGFRAWQIVLVAGIAQFVRKLKLKFPCKAGEQIVQ